MKNFANRFSSATGTGKSLSLICGSLTWLRNFEKDRVENLKQKINEITKENERQDDSESDDWISASFKKREKLAEKMELKKELDFLLQKIEKIKELRRSRQKIHQRDVQKVDADFDELFRDAKEIQDAVRKELNSMQCGFSSEENDCILDDYLSDEEKEDKDLFDLQEKPTDYSLRIFYCSRTHSQLSQFVKEIQKTDFASDIRLISLASRSNMCINDSVLALKNSSLINERCLEMQKGKSKTKKDPNDPPQNKRSRKQKSDSSCPFYKSSAIANLRDQSLLEVHDIEQIVGKGKQMSGCPYYASRKAVEDAQVVVLPYNTLLHSSTRQALGLDLTNSVIIIDEAHNVLETIAHIHSAEMTLSHLEHAQDQLKGYFQRFQSMLKAKNLLYVKQLLLVIAKFIGFMKKEKDSKLLLLTDFWAELDIFQINLFKLIRYIEKSRICQKLQNYGNKKKDENADANKAGNVCKKGLSAFLNSITTKKVKYVLSTYFFHFRVFFLACGLSHS